MNENNLNVCLQLREERYVKKIKFAITVQPCVISCKLSIKNVDPLLTCWYCSYVNDRLMFSSREFNPWSWSTLILALDSKFPISLRTTPWDEFRGKITSYPTDSKLRKHLVFLAFQPLPGALPESSLYFASPCIDHEQVNHSWEVPLKPMEHSHSNKGFDWTHIWWAQWYSERTNQCLPYMKFPWSVIHQQKHGRKGDNSERYARGIFGW